ncbi:MAG: hypothetical protein AB3N63_09615 [Puniceicoccaceae bacterium]
MMLQKPTPYTQSLRRQSLIPAKFCIILRKFASDTIWMVYES